METLERALRAWSGLACRRPLGMTAGVLGAAALLAVAAAHLSLENDFDAMVPTPSGRILARIDAAFGIREQAFLVVESASENRQALITFGRALSAELERCELIGEVVSGIDEEASLLLERLAPYGPRFTRVESGDFPAALLSRQDLGQRLDRQLARLALPGSSLPDARIRRDPLDLGQPLLERLDSLRGAYRFDRSSREFISEDGRALLVRIQGRRALDDRDGVRRTVGAIEEAVEAARRRVPEASLTVHAGGGYFLAVESEEVVRRDLTRGMVLSVILVFLLLAAALRGPAPALLVLPPVLLGILAGVGIHGVFRSTLATLSLGSASILVGLGVDFAIHLLLRAGNERARGLPAVDALVGAAGAVGPALLLAALTTAAAFLAFLASRHRFLADMGALTASGIAATFVVTLSLLPALARRWLERQRRPRAPRPLGVDRVVEAALRAPGAVLAVAGLLTLASLALLAADPPLPETDLRRIHARDSRALLAGERLGRLFGGAHEPLMLLLEAADETSLEGDLRRLRPALERLVEEGHLAAHLSAAVLLPDAGVEARVIEHFRSRPAEALSRDIDAALEERGFDTGLLAAATGRAVEAAVDERPLTLARLRELGLGQWIDTLVREDPGRSGGLLGLVTLFPAAELWTPDARERTLGKIREALGRAGIVAPPAGLFTVSAESAGQVLAELGTIGGLAFLAAVLMMGLFFRDPTSVLLALLPVTLACIWTAALFRLAGHSIHFMNAAVLPMIVGIGIDDGIHIVHRFRVLSRRTAGEQKGGGDGPGAAFRLAREALAVTGTGVALTSLTTMLAFGSLALSRNRGLASLGVLCVIGVGTSLLASITVLPAALRAIAARRGAPARALPTPADPPPSSSTSSPPAGGEGSGGDGHG